MTNARVNHRKKGTCTGEYIRNYFATPPSPDSFYNIHTKSTNSLYCVRLTMTLLQPNKLLQIRDTRAPDISLHANTKTSTQGVVPYSHL